MPTSSQPSNVSIFAWEETRSGLSSSVRIPSSRHRLAAFPHWRWCFTWCLCPFALFSFFESSVSTCLSTVYLTSHFHARHTILISSSLSREAHILALSAVFTAHTYTPTLTTKEFRNMRDCIRKNWVSLTRWVSLTHISTKLKASRTVKCWYMHIWTSCYKFYFNETW